MVLNLKLVLIAAVSDLKGKRVIGSNGRIPWFSDDKVRKPDLERFKRLTLNKPIIMGRPTFESLDYKPLPQRTNIVVSGSSDMSEYQGAIQAHNPDEALEIAAKFGETAYVIGGGRLYAQTILSPYAVRLEITEVTRKYDGDVHFPPIDWDVWQLQDEDRHEHYSFLTFGKRKLPLKKTFS